MVQLVGQKYFCTGRNSDAHRMQVRQAHCGRLRLIGTRRGCAAATWLWRLLHSPFCYNAAVMRRVFTIAIKVLRRLWIILTSDTLTYREYAAIMLILTFVGFTAWDLVDGNNLTFSLLFACPVLFAAAGFLYPSFVNRRHARRILTNHCVVCGYDLCATPDRCPECGFVPTGKIKN